MPHRAALRVGFGRYRGRYRAFDQDAEDKPRRSRCHDKLAMPVLAVGVAKSTSGPVVDEMIHEVVEDVTGLRVPGAAHWVAEENATAFTVALLKFLTAAAG